jgi:antitoxin component YwqK of YwqJK toxin-antitoxin module
MKHCFFLFLLVCPLLLFAQKTRNSTINQLFEKPVERRYYVKERYYKGNLYVEGQAVQKIYSKKKRIELKRGPWKWYFRNGQVKDSAFYSDFGLPTGIEIKYNSDGSLHEKIDYGTSTNFKIRERNWLTTIAKDYTRTFYHKGLNTPKKTVTYLNKKKEGTWQKFDTKGNLIWEKTYSSGKLISSKKY